MKYYLKLYISMFERWANYNNFKILILYCHHSRYVDEYIWTEEEGILYYRWIDDATNDNYRNRDSAAACDLSCNYIYIHIIIS